MKTKPTKHGLKRTTSGTVADPGLSRMRDQLILLRLQLNDCPQENQRKDLARAVRNLEVLITSLEKRDKLKIS